MGISAPVIGAARLSFGSARRLGERLGVGPGAVSPLALINDGAAEVRVILDADVMTADVANFHPLTNDATTVIKPADLGLVKFFTTPLVGPVETQVLDDLNRLVPVFKRCLFQLFEGIIRGGNGIVD